MKYFLVVLVSVLLFSCESGKYKEVPLSQFEGKWKLCGREIYQDMTITIKRNSENKLIGTIDTLNENKFVQFFMTKGDKLISSIERRSNFEFIVTEKKIGSELFGMYDLSTTEKYNVRFHSPDTIRLSKDVYYLRVK